MLPEFMKLWGLKLISAGLKAPENPLDRFIEFTILKHLLAKLEIDCVLDVGANYRNHPDKGGSRVDPDWRAAHVNADAKREPRRRDGGLREELAKGMIADSARRGQTRALT